MSFVGLHIHSDYSLLDGASQLPQLVARAVELGMPAIALTDHGVMYGAIELIKVCRTKNIKPIIGNEMYIINGEIDKQERRRKYHQIVLAKNTKGYKNLVKLTTISHLKGRQGKGIFSRPCINKELLEQYHEGLIVTSGCMAGEIPQNILQGKLDEARKVALWYKDLLGEDYYLEIQDHGQWEDRVVNVEIVKIARELDIKIVATNDSHYISCYDVEAHDALLCINTNKLITEDKRLRYSGTEYLKSEKEMAQLFRDHLPDEVIEEAIANTLEVANKVKSYDIMGEPRLPNYPVPPDHTADTYVEEIAREGLRERFKCRSYSELEPVYRERLDYELKMIQRMGFSTYFLVVWDYIKYARDNDIPVGPGRGSAAGSLVAYALKITNIDPVHHGLLFERFLNPERKSMPDIDTDFCIDNRDKVIEYVTNKYGSDRVAQIITFNKLTSKAVLKDVARVLNIPYGESDKMAKLIPVVRGKPTKLKVMISDDTPSPEFKSAYENSEIKIKDPTSGEESSIPVRRWIEMAMRIEGTNKTYGVHAAGVVISAEPLDEIVPLQVNNEGAVITQYFMEDLESLGLLKMDFLGLRNLTIIQKTIDLIKEHQNVSINPDDVTDQERRANKILAKGEIKNKPNEVAKTYKVLENGDLEGIFQLESSGMRQIVRDLKPSNIEDISSILALYRPGPLDAGLIPKFIDRKHGRENIDYPHELLEPILNETYGILCYQEQIMKMAQDLAGYSLGQADLLRRAMGKKKAEEMQKQRDTFIDGAARNGVSRKIAEALFEQMVQFAEYCFNKSHSTAYAYVTYQTAFLKANYKVEYMAALLTANSGDTDKVQKYITNAQNIGIVVEGPDINRSLVDFTPMEGKIVFGLSAVRNVGEGAIACILESRDKEGKFTSLADLCDRINLHSVNSRALEALIKCGAFDSIEKNRKQLVEHLPLVTSWAQKSKKASDQPTLFDLAEVRSPAPKLPLVADFSTAEKLQMEKELLGFYVSEHPLKSIEKVAAGMEPAPITISQLNEQRDKSKVTAIALIIEVKQVTTKKGDRMAILQMEDLSGKAEGVVFPRTYEALNSSLVTDTPLIIKGKVDKQDERTQIIVEDIQPIPVEQLVAETTSPPVEEQETNFPTYSDNNDEDNVPIDADYEVRIQLTPQRVNEERGLDNLRSILKEYSGDRNKAKVPVIAVVVGKNQTAFVKLGKAFWVQNHKRAVEALNSAGFSASVHPATKVRDRTTI
ncbi:DNA polymerase III subunit alpha [Microcoleus sp. FACHB-831]|uniref:DNA polymerase III subunit alpha n=1 Tax=Microcoleus sp. FACHB-831 TaxID=2692827 RepID=UPI001687E6B0|nr:DNA polymerase III subunit alpha [Microcoleus sp. FACHB-831]MBD1921795.1 DNA polymerase III subunit alpha [Microcoleus sp. FACHB-831]